MATCVCEEISEVPTERRHHTHSRLFGRGIPHFMLERAVSPQKRWDERGVEYEAKLHESLLRHTAVIGVEVTDGMETCICGWESAELHFPPQPNNPVSLNTTSLMITSLILI